MLAIIFTRSFPFAVLKPFTSFEKLVANADTEDL
jgi:hypothetical protein